MAQLRFEVHRALPVLEASIDGPAVVDEVARLAVSGRSGAEVVQVTAPDITDVTSLGVRASDGGSIYRPPNEERYCTLAHLDIEEQILAAAKRAVPQLVSREQARAAAERTGLNAEQRDAVVMMLTADRGDGRAGRPGRGGQEPHHGRVRPAVDHLHRPPGHRPDHLHQRGPGPGPRGPGRELQHRRSSSARPKAPTSCAGPCPCTRTTCSSWTRPASSATADLAMIGEAARQAGARIIATGDTAQLGAVEAGGMFRLLAQEVPAAAAARGPPVRRGLGTASQHPAPRRRPGRDRRLRPARPHPRRRLRGRLRPGRLHVARRPPARQGRAAARRIQRRSRRPVPPRPGQAHPARHRRTAAGRRWPTATTPASAT